MYYINAISSISHQPTFDNLGFSDKLCMLDKNSETLTFATFKSIKIINLQSLRNTASFFKNTFHVENYDIFLLTNAG